MVSSDVGPQIASESKVFIANFAFMWLITGVNVHVIFQISWLTETSVANLTFEWPAAIVDVHVGLEIAWRWKGF